MQVQLKTSAPARRRQEGAPRVVVCILGAFQVVDSAQQVLLRGGGKAEVLLSSLAVCSERGMTRERLINLMWPDGEATLAGQSLNSLTYSLHRRLGPALGGSPPVSQVGGRYVLNAGAGVAVDLARFDELATQADTYQRNGVLDKAADIYAAAADLYGGDLTGCADVQGVIERERVRARYLGILAHLADHCFKGQDYSGCLDYALRLLATDPCREDGHRLAMVCYVRRGERAQALRQFRVCESVLSAEYDARPEAATCALYERIRGDEAGV